MALSVISEDDDEPVLALIDKEAAIRACDHVAPPLSGRVPERRSFLSVAFVQILQEPLNPFGYIPVSERILLAPSLPAWGCTQVPRFPCEIHPFWALPVTVSGSAQHLH
jgi:hypothetical protein